MFNPGIGVNVGVKLGALSKVYVVCFIRRLFGVRYEKYRNQILLAFSERRYFHMEDTGLLSLG